MDYNAISRAIDEVAISTVRTIIDHAENASKHMRVLPAQDILAQPEALDPAALKRAL